MSKLIQDYKKLNTEQKKKKLLLILDGLKNSHPIFSNIISSINNNKSINEDFLIGIYGDIIEFGELLENNKKSQAEKKLDNIKNILNKIRKQERIEKENDNPDDILNFIS